MKNMKGQGKHYRNYESDDPILDYPQVNHEIRGDVKDVKISQKFALLIPMIGSSEDNHPLDVWCNTRFL